MSKGIWVRENEKSLLLHLIRMNNYEQKFACYLLRKYRPTDYSIMRYNVGGYNAPSREAIYKRIMKLSEGSGWEYDYETFVAYDAVNRSNASQTYYREEVENFDESTFVPLAPPVWVDRDISWRLTD